MRSSALMHAFLATLLAAGPVLAQDSPSSGDREIETVPVRTGDDAPPEDLVSSTYSTIGISKLSADFDNVNDAINLEGTLIGLRIPTFPWVGVEINGSFTVIPGQVKDSPSCGGLGQPACSGNNSNSQDPFQTFNFGVFGVVRTPGTLFAVGKIGYQFINTSLPELDNQSNATSWAAGVGYRWSRDGFAELSYSKIADDIDAIGVTFSYSHDR